MHQLNLAVIGFALAGGTLAPAQTNTNPITREMVVAAEKLIGLNFSERKLDLMLPGLKEQLDTPTSICFIGKLFGEAELLAVAKKYQDATDFHRKHPALEN